MLKFLLILFSVFIFLTFSQNLVLADAQKDFKIFDLKKSLPLSDKEKPLYDYYINIGQDHGVQPGQIINVYRRVPVMDIYKNQNHPDMRVAVGKLKVIYSQKSMSVGRVYLLSKRDNTPVLEFEKLMVGDRVEQTNMTEDDFKPKNKRKVASQKVVVAPVVQTQELKLPEPVAPTVQQEIESKKD